MKRIKLRGLLLTLIGIIIALSAGILLVACGDDNEPPPAVSKSSIHYDGTKFSWSKAKNATKYTLVIDEKEYSTPNTQFGYKYKDGDTVSISITAVNSYGKSSAVSREFTRLETIADLEFDEVGLMSWEEIEGASGYEVSINNTTHKVAAAEFDNFEYGKRNTIKVRPVGGGDTFSFWSDSVSKEYLGTPTDIDYDGQDLTWKGYAGAVSYTVYINGSKDGISNKSSYAFSANQNSFSVAVVANGDGVDSFDSKMSDEKEYTFLGAISKNDFQVADGKLTWEAVEGAESYKVKVGGRTEVVRKTEYDLIENQTMKISVMPYSKDTGNHHYFSEWSEETSYLLLSAPRLQWNSSLAMNGEANNALFWQSVNNCDGYEIIIYDSDKHPITSGRTQRENPSYGYAFREVGRYTVQVRSLAAMGGDTVDSKWSDPLTVERLQAPNADTIPVTSTADDLNEGFTVHFTPVRGADGYTLYREGTTAKIDARNGANSISVPCPVDETQTSEQHITYELQSLGSNRIISGESRVTLDSLTREQGNSSPRTFDITVLPRPENVSISGWTVSWTDVNKSYGYAVKTMGNNPDVANNAEWDLHNIVRSSGGNYDMQICARGNGTNILPSLYTTPIKLVKLAAPTNVHADTNVSNGLIKCDSVVHADGYEVYFNGDTNQGHDSATQIDINQYITETTVTVTMRALANRWDNSTTENRYLITSDLSEPRQLTRLSAPTNLRFSGSQLIWNAPDNINNSVPGIRYEVYKDANATDMYTETLSGTSMSTANLAGGQSHFFTIRCVGDGYQFLSSELSGNRTVYKQETPEISLDHGDDGYGFYKWTDASADYSISIEGSAPTTVKAGVNKYIPKFAEWKSSFKVEFIAVGDNENTINSNPRSINQQMVRLSKPAVGQNVKYVSGTKDINGNSALASDGRIEVTLPAKDANSVGYRIMCGSPMDVDGVDEQTYEIKPISVNVYKVRVVALGGRFDSNGVYYFDSEASDEKSINVLGAPNLDGIRHQSGRISWTGILGCSGYEVVIEYEKDGNTKTFNGKTQSNDGSAFKLTDINDDVTWDMVKSVKIRALGNGDSTVSSEYSEKTIR